MGNRVGPDVRGLPENLERGIERQGVAGICSSGRLYDRDVTYLNRMDTSAHLIRSSAG